MKHRARERLPQRTETTASNRAWIGMRDFRSSLVRLDDGNSSRDMIRQ